MLCTLFEECPFRNDQGELAQFLSQLCAFPSLLATGTRRRKVVIRNSTHEEAQMGASKSLQCLPLPSRPPFVRLQTQLTQIICPIVQVLRSISWINAHTGERQTLGKISHFPPTTNTLQSNSLPLPPSVLSVTAAARLSEAQVFAMTHSQPHLRTSSCEPALSPASRRAQTQASHHLVVGDFRHQEKHGSADQPQVCPSSLDVLKRPQRGSHRK